MAYRDDSPPVPKPYDFVPISPLSEADRKMPQGHDAYHKEAVSGELTATLVVATPMHVGDGQMRFRPGQSPRLVRSITRVDGQPCIPASTLKGVVRSVVEAITRSCVRVTRARSSDLPRGAASCRQKNNLCLACRMFGAMGFEGHVRFADAIFEGDESDLKIARMPALYAPRKRTGHYYKGSQVAGRKFYYHGRTVTDANTPVETLPLQALLTLTVRFEDLTEGELGVLLTALGLGKTPLTLKLGGGKPVCYGSFMILPEQLEVDADPAAMYGSYEGASRQNMDLKDYVQAADALIERSHLKQLAEIWQYDMNRHCPGGDY
jgi:hypothetical protein